MVVEAGADPAHLARRAPAATPTWSACWPATGERLRPLAERVVGRTAEPLSAADGLGRLAAEAQRAFAKADLALVDAGSFRARSTPARSPTPSCSRRRPTTTRSCACSLRGSELRDILGAGSGPALYTAGLPRTATPTTRPWRTDASSIPRATYTVVANALLVATGPFDALREAAARGREVGSQVEALARYTNGLPQPIRPGQLRTAGSVAVVGDELTAARWSASRRPELLCPVYRRSPSKSTA